MHKRLKTNKIFVWFIVLFAFSFIGCSNSTKADSKPFNPNDYAKEIDASDLRVQDYFPKKSMKKYFTGGFENGGFKQTIDKFKGDKVQVKQLDTGTGVAFVYQLKRI
ncbi:hypothetical protein [Desnuesiella massiliensis]|uniref:hypothetical protein n=1 Tax=Desnuesiella massiliensis TaxID=1650662 RepID=UPI0006E16101|nr:hypothetical protein [Desnuesiella massiliensis]